MKWSEEDIATLHRMLAKDYCNAEIGLALGRSKYAVQTYRRDQARTEEQRAIRRARANELARDTKKNTARRAAMCSYGERPADRPSIDLLLERDRRLALRPRDLTGVLMGDPPIGESALERRA